MEVETESRVKPLSYKVKAMSRESPSQKATNLLDTDLRNHWSTGTNTKEWILLELDEPCLLSHLRIYNKSVLEWEISVGLRYKPENFIKVRPRCEAPRHDVTYPMSYSPCRYVRISCLRGNPIALFFVQLMGIAVPCLEPEFQSIANHLIPHISSSKQDASDLYLQLLQDLTSRLGRFVPQLEAELNCSSEAVEPTLHFLAMLAGPCFPILHMTSERETARLALSVSENDASKSIPSSTTLMVSSNFEPRRSRHVPSGSALLPVVFHADTVLSLLRKAFKDPHLGKVCRMASRILLKLVEPMTVKEVSAVASSMSPSVSDDPISIPDYSSLFGDEFQVSDDFWDSTYLNVLDSALVEEGILHVLYGCASQPVQCRKLAENSSHFWLALPLIQALLPALQPNISISYHIDDNFSLWKQPFVQKALSQVVATSSSVFCRPLLHACAGYLASFSQSHAKAACVLIDLCSGVLSPWMAQVIAKVDLAMELLEDLFAIVQAAQSSFSRAYAALKYIVLALSGNVDDVMALYKDAKHRILFLLEMLGPYLDPAFTPVKSTIAFGNVTSLYTEQQEKNCARALNIIRTAIRKPGVLPSLEAAWRHGSIAPSVLLSVLDSRLQFPPDIDNCKFSATDTGEQKSGPDLLPNELTSSTLNKQEISDVKTGVTDANAKIDPSEVAILLFAPAHLNGECLTHAPTIIESKSFNPSLSLVNVVVNNADLFPECLETFPGIRFCNLFADYHHIMKYRDCELKASEFRHLALHVRSQGDIPESHDVAVDALLLAAECYINPCFMMSLEDVSSVEKVFPKFSNLSRDPAYIKMNFGKDDGLKHVADLERTRDRVVLEILIEAAELHRKHEELTFDENFDLYTEENGGSLPLTKDDILSADAISLTRQNQALLFDFLIHRLQKGSHEEDHSINEILMWLLLFLLHSATKLFCSSELVVDVILNFAKSLNIKLKSNYVLEREDSLFKKLKMLELQRCFILLHQLVIAASGSEEKPTLFIGSGNGFRFLNLVPALAWVLKVPVFSSSAFPLVRYFGWMAISRISNQFLVERLFLVSDLTQLRRLLSVFWDDLALVDNIAKKKGMDEPIEDLNFGQAFNVVDGSKPFNHGDGMQPFHVFFPDICKFFPNLSKDFVGFSETILEAVGLQLKMLSSSVMADLMSWLSDLCAWPFIQSENPSRPSQQNTNHYKGFVSKNAKAVILYVIESIVVEHMEAMVPEAPRAVQVLASLCKCGYCDAPFLKSVLCLLKPIVTYSSNKVSSKELLGNTLLADFEALCFSDLFNNIKISHEIAATPVDKEAKVKSLMIYVLASFLDNLSFEKKMELLDSSLLWADFTSAGDTSSFQDYIFAYQVLLENFRSLLISTSRSVGVVPIGGSSHSDTDVCTNEDFSELSSSFLCDICDIVSPSNTSANQNNSNMFTDAFGKVHQLNLEDASSFSKPLEALSWKLCPSLEICWKLHPKLSKMLLLTCAESFIYSRCLYLFMQNGLKDSADVPPSSSVDNSHDLWRVSIEGLSEMILYILEKKCWQVASVLLHSFLRVPKCIRLENVIGDICLAIKKFSNSAPNMCWRLQTDGMLSSLLERGIHNVCHDEVALVDLFSVLLGHPEPEQRYVALKNLKKLVVPRCDDGKSCLSSTATPLIALSDSVVAASEPILSSLVSATWDLVALVASNDMSLHLRTHAMALLISFIPFVERTKLQSFLASTDSVLHSLVTLAGPTRYSPLTQFSLALIASVCLYSSPDDISLIPESVWTSIEAFGASKNDRCCTSFERKACDALLRLRNNGEEAKLLLKEVLSSSSNNLQNPDFVATRDSILQVVGKLTSAKTYFDFFSNKADEKIMELEEAEIEMELVQKESPPQDLSSSFHEWSQIPTFSTSEKVDHRLQKIKDEIKSIEKAKIREEVVARRQQALLLRVARQKYLEEAAVREAELLQNLDREKANEVEKELERREQLVSERAKTRELQHSLDMEKEKQAQRDIQRELEQLESGIRSSRRDFSQTRARDKFRERESSRDGSEVALRPGVNRPFSGQVPTILQARERSDEGGGSYEETFEGGKDSLETASLGDPDTVSLEGQPPRQGSRSGKPRQIIERRERESRREGKWERKH